MWDFPNVGCGAPAHRFGAKSENDPSICWVRESDIQGVKTTS